ncbi:MAG: acyltransferase [Actinomycetota bacterium]
MRDPGSKLGRFLTRRKMQRIIYSAVPAFMPPPPRAFAAYGQDALIAAPGRIEGAEFITIGKRVKILEHIWLIARREPGRPPPRLILGDDVLINRFVKIVSVGEVVIERDTMIGDNCYISDTHYLYDDPDRSIQEQGLAPSRPVHIGAGCHIAFRSTIRPGVTLADYVHVGPGSVVSDDMPERSVVHGDPARVIRRYDAARGEWLFVRPGMSEREAEGTADTV